MKLTKKNYFSPEANKAFMSVSQFKSFERCPASALAEINGEYEREETTALLVGSYCDAYFDGTLEQFKLAHPEIFKKDGTLKAEYIQANSIIERIEKDPVTMQYLTGRKQVIMTGEISGVPVKIMMDVYKTGKRIVDRKIVKDFDNIYDPEKGSVPWFEYWGYDLQGAVYQEIVRQNTGLKLPFFLSAATKEKITDLDLIEIPQHILDFQLERFAANVERFDAMKKGIIEPDRCELCDYCKLSKVLTAPKSADEFYLI
jgi:hypothetical protein